MGQAYEVYEAVKIEISQGCYEGWCEMEFFLDHEVQTKHSPKIEMASRQEWRPPRQDIGFDNDGLMAPWLCKNGRRLGKFYP